MGYAKVYTESVIPRTRGKFQMSKECADNRQELRTGIMYWAKTNEIEIYTGVIFVNIAIKEMVKTKFNPGLLLAMYEIAKSGI